MIKVLRIHCIFAVFLLYALTHHSFETFNNSPFLFDHHQILTLCSTPRDVPSSQIFVPPLFLAVSEIRTLKGSQNLSQNARRTDSVSLWSYICTVSSPRTSTMRTRQIYREMQRQPRLSVHRARTIIALY